MKPVTNKGKQSTRDTILHALKSSNQATVEELAETAEVSPVTVRHHLNALQAEGLIEVDSVRRKVGRPYYVYSLSESGHELFPHKYVRLTNRLLDELKARLPAEQLQQIFQGVVQNILQDHKGSFESMAFEERLSYLVSMLSEEGFLVKWEKKNGRYTLTEYGCPYYSIGQEHTEICGMDKSLMVTILQTPVEQHTCMLQGDECCQFTFSPKTAVS
ncbi:MAG: ArsR family transcriptional regulator [Ardenticatenaceae bacterium]|nr:ArsR family transcriptional regulator [Ardenticatenaceae bacterium]